MSIETDNPYELRSRENGRRRIFPGHHGDFSNLEDLQELLGSAARPLVMTGSVKPAAVTLDPQSPCPHALVTAPDSPYSYDFIKINEDTYVLKVVTKQAES